MRLDKLLANLGICGRRTATVSSSCFFFFFFFPCLLSSGNFTDYSKEFISKNYVSYLGQRIQVASMEVLPSDVMINGRPLEYAHP
jgi:hypothetical protein